MSHQEERLEIMKQFIKSSGWKYICEEIDASIECNRIKLENPDLSLDERNTLKLQLDNQNLKLLKELPSKLTFDEDMVVMDNEDEL